MDFVQESRDFVRRKRWQSKLVQFSYDHSIINTQFLKLRKSAGELNRMLNNMTGSKEKKTEKTEGKGE